MKNILAFSIILGGLVNKTNAMTLNCYEENNPKAVFAIELNKGPLGQNSGPAKAQFSNQILDGVYRSMVITKESRLKGYTNVYFKANNSKVTLTGSLIGINGPVLQYWGNANLFSTSAVGQLIDSYLVSCK